MSIISPLHTKLTIRMPSTYVNRDQRPMSNINKYTLFLLLEKQRNKKLREVYRCGGLATSRNEERPEEDFALPKAPPRYQCLDLSAEWLASEVSKKRRELLVHNSTREQWKTDLDQVSKLFLEDLANVLKERYGGYQGSPQTTSSVLPYMPTLSPTAITPPPSPITIPQAECEDSMLLPNDSSEIHNEEVDISDAEIMSIWDCTVPSEDGIDFSVCL